MADENHRRRQRGTDPEAAGNGGRRQTIHVHLPYRSKDGPAAPGDTQGEAASPWAAGCREWPTHSLPAFRRKHSGGDIHEPLKPHAEALLALGSTPHSIFLRSAGIHPWMPHTEALLALGPTPHSIFLRSAGIHPWMPHTEPSWLWGPPLILSFSLREKRAVILRVFILQNNTTRRQGGRRRGVDGG
jgi:hypothetical protein